MAAIKKSLQDKQFGLLIQPESPEVVSAVNELFANYFAQIYESVTTDSVSLEDLEEQRED